MLTAENLIDILLNTNGRYSHPISYRPIPKLLATPPHNTNTYPWRTGQANNPNSIALNMYDWKLLSKVAHNGTLHEGKYSEAQRKIILKLIHKYRKQLNEKFLLPNIHNWCNSPIWYFDARPTDRIYSLDFVEGHFEVKFPYYTKIVSKIGEMASAYDLPTGSKWIKEGRYWHIEPTPGGCELILRLMNSVKNEEKNLGRDVEFAISSLADLELRSRFVFRNKINTMSIVANELVVNSFNSDRQKIMAEEVLSGPLSLYQKISYLAYMNFRADETMKDCLRKQGLVDWQIDLLCQQETTLDYSAVPQSEIYKFLSRIKLGLVLELCRDEIRMAEIQKYWGFENNGLANLFIYPSYKTNPWTRKALDVHQILWAENFSNQTSLSQLLADKYTHNVVGVYSSNIGRAEVPVLIAYHPRHHDIYKEDTDYIKVINLVTSKIDNEECEVSN